MESKLMLVFDSACCLDSGYAALAMFEERRARILAVWRPIPDVMMKMTAENHGDRNEKQDDPCQNRRLR